MAGLPRIPGMILGPLQFVLGGLCGILVGLVLGVVGGGGSILAVPLMVYVVGVGNPHIAIGTSAFAVAANAAFGVINHARSGTIKWRCAVLFAGPGVAGTFVGSSIGKAFDGRSLLVLFAIIMVAVGLLMLRNRSAAGNAGAQCNRSKAPKILGYGLGTGIISGFFGIGGGFLIVPGLIASTGMPILNAVGSSLVAVTAFGFATAMSYSLSGMVAWPLAFVFVLGGVLGNLVGAGAARRLSGTRGLLTTVLALVILVVAAYILCKSAGAYVNA